MTRIEKIALAGAAGGLLEKQIKEYTKRYKQIRFALILIFIIGTILTIIGSLLIHYLKHKKPVLYTAIVFLVLALICFIAGSVMIYMIVRIVSSLEDSNFQQPGPEILANLNYPKMPGQSQSVPHQPMPQQPIMQPNPEVAVAPYPPSAENPAVPVAALYPPPLPNADGGAPPAGAMPAAPSTAPIGFEQTAALTQ